MRKLYKVLQDFSQETVSNSTPGFLKNTMETRVPKKEGKDLIYQNKVLNIAELEMLLLHHTFTIHSCLLSPISPHGGPAEQCSELIMTPWPHLLN